MSTHDTERTFRLPRPGDLVTRTGTTVFRVVEVTEPDWVRGHRNDGTRRVHMVSVRSGRRYDELLGCLWWPKSEAGGLGAQIVPYGLQSVAPSPAHEAARETPAGIGSDGMSAAVIAWTTPVLSGREGEPSSVALCVSHDGNRRRFLRVEADGPAVNAGAFLDRASALQLAAHLTRLADRL